MNENGFSAKRVDLWKFFSEPAERTEIFVGLLLLGATAFGVVVL